MSNQHNQPAKPQVPPQVASESSTRGDLNRCIEILELRRKAIPDRPENARPLGMLVGAIALLKAMIGDFPSAEERRDLVAQAELDLDAVLEKHAPLEASITLLRATCEQEATQRWALEDYRKEHSGWLQKKEGPEPVLPAILTEESNGEHVPIGVIPDSRAKLQSVLGFWTDASAEIEAARARYLRAKAGAR